MHDFPKNDLDNSISYLSSFISNFSHSFPKIPIHWCAFVLLPPYLSGTNFSAVFLWIVLLFFFGFQLIFPRFWPKHCHHSSFPILLRLRLKNIQKNHVTCSMEIGFYNSIICYPNINVLVSSFQCVSDNGVFIYMYYRFPYVLLPLDILLVSKMFIIFGFYWGYGNLIGFFIMRSFRLKCEP